MINFNYTNSKNYKLVQSQLSELVQEHLDVSQFQNTYKKYSEGDLNFTWFIRQKADVLMPHGVADKNYYWVMDEKSGRRIVNSLKAVLVPGRWLQSRMIKSQYITLQPEQIIPVGWPRINFLRKLQAEFKKDADTTKLTLLWAPTHDFRKRGADEKSTSSYPEFEPYAKQLEANYNVLYSLHPRNRTDKKPTVDKLLNADVVISDFGTMVYEAWALGKPVIFPRWILGDSIIQYVKNSAEAYIFKNNIGYHPQSYEEMLDILESGPVVDDRVHAFMEEYLDNYKEGDSAKKIADTLLELHELELSKSNHMTPPFKLSLTKSKRGWWSFLVLFDATKDSNLPYKNISIKFDDIIVSKTSVKSKEDGSLSAAFRVSKYILATLMKYHELYIEVDDCSYHIEHEDILMLLIGIDNANNDKQNLSIKDELQKRYILNAKGELVKGN